MADQRKAPPQAWQPGQSGNPKGKPRGTRNKATLMVLKLMEGGAKEITEAVIEAAKGGDLSAARLVLDRLCPPARERPVSLELPETSTAVGISRAQQAVFEAVANGQLLPGEAATLSGLLEAQRKVLETVEIEARLTALEEKST